MASSSAPPRKCGLGRGPTKVPKAPTNPNDQILLQVPPDGGDFADIKVVKCISQLCLQGWPTSVIAWSVTPTAHKQAVWQEFQKRYRWAEADAHKIEELFWLKCLV